ncbi:unnamed protein product [Rhizophagus irregularis]|uniref:Serine-threonine/tyrosine-protein kinase catalytic domain-containing protein n=1 Tax=Rhizophagus irregularis TaxID=588596 RepID=A0A916E5L3_9GLOM|nr:unnamed protein product [Rhizophagus irregularis]
MFEISNGKRETPIPNTPSEYINIYTKCWKDNPDDRPDMEQVFSELKQEAESDGATQSAKQQTKSKAKELGNLAEDDDELNKIELKSLMRKLLEKIYTQDEYKIKVEDPFKSQANIDICRMLIPKLQEDFKLIKYNPSYKQVEECLRSIHKTGRNTYLKSIKTDID